MTDVFISYSRKDKEFVQRLHAALLVLKRNTWVDWQDILPTEKWWLAIASGIEAADAFVFVISPDSAGSVVCTREISYALTCHKRLVPIVRRDVEPEKVHPALSAHNWIFMREDDDFEAALAKVIEALDTDIEHVRSHTRLLIKALEWEREGRDNSFLLRGKDLAASERWLGKSSNKHPAPTDLQLDYISTSRTMQYRRPKLRSTVMAAGVVTGVVIAIRFFGVLVPLELWAYDLLMRSRPPEPQDDRILLVTVDEQASQRLDQNYGINRAASIPEPVLSDVLAKLQANQPRVIGVDLYYPAAASPALAEQLQTDNLVALCKNSERDREGTVIRDGTKPPPDVSKERIGFADAVGDSGKLLRRQLLDIPADPQFCNTDSAFSLVIARRYLDAEGVAVQPLVTPDGTYPSVWTWNRARFQRLDHNTGYQDQIDRNGFQVLLNYRATQNGPADFAPQVSLTQVLDNQVPEALIRDRIVLIGVADATTSTADFWSTPYGDRQIPGVVLQGQMTSQIISAVLDGRPTLGWPSVGLQFVWIAGWSLIGAFIIWGTQRLLVSGFAIVTAYFTLGMLCYGLLIAQGSWFPLIPAAIALLLAQVAVGYLTYRLRKSW